MYPHRIRLRGPWECEPVAVAASELLPLPTPRRMAIPCRWAEGGLPGFRGRVRLRRRFGYPGRLDDYERVWLTFAGASDRASAALNGTLLGEHTATDAAFEYDVTALLRQRNELLVEVEGGADGGLWGEVALEVRCTAFLRHMQYELIETGEGFAQIQVSGELVGSAPDMLELYVLLDRSTIAYAVLPPPVAAQRFQLVSEKRLLDNFVTEPNAAHRLRVDLVNRATVWYTWEQEWKFKR